MEKCVALTDVGCTKLGVEQRSELSAGCNSLGARVSGFAFWFVGQLITCGSYHNKPAASQHLLVDLEHRLCEFRHSFTVIGNYQIFLRIKSRSPGICCGFM